MKMPANPRLQRTRAARAPLSRQPFGDLDDPRQHKFRRLIFYVLVIGLFAACTTSQPSPRQTVALEPLEIHIPGYPDNARKARMEGLVEITVSVNSGGVVTSSAVSKSLNPLLDRAATNAAMRWRFQPSGSSGVRSVGLVFEYVLWDGGDVEICDLIPTPIVLAPYHVRVFGFMRTPR